MKILITIVLLISGTLFLDAQTTFVKRFSVEPELSQTLVKNISQDYLGYVWIGTEEGLYRYDGYNLKPYNSFFADSTKLLGNRIRAIFEDNLKRLWVSSESCIYLYIRGKDIFRAYRNFSNFSQINSVRCIYQAKNGQVFIGTDKELASYDEKSDNFKIEKACEPVVSICEFSKNLIMLGTTKGVKLYNTFNSNFIQNADSKTITDEIGNIKINSVVKSEDRNLWIATFGKGLYKFNLDNKTISAYKIQTPNENNLIIRNITSVYCDRQDNIWACTDNGLFRLNKANNTFGIYTSITASDNSLFSLVSKVIYQDRSNAIWLVTSLGIVIFDAAPKNFIPYKISIPDNNNLNLNLVWHFAEAENNVVWIATKAGLVKFDRNQNEYQLFEIKPENSEIKDNNIFTLHKTDDESIWIGTCLNGLVKFNPKTKKFFSYKYSDANATLTGHNSVLCIAKADN